ncbi:hypothetical protein [Ralstonia syzygii]|uniref:hypothetical protein n=1 Tax=Ralstonia syzygii TaxID=28097 RepID=UPI0035149808
MQAIAIDLALLEFLHQLGGGDDGAHALLRHQHHVVGRLDQLRDEVDVVEAAEIDHLQVEEGAQAVQQPQRLGERNVAHLRQRDRQGQYGQPVRVARQRGLHEHLVEAAQVAHRLHEMEMGRDVQVQRTIAQRLAEVEQHHVAAGGAPHQRRQVGRQRSGAHTGPGAQDGQHAAPARRLGGCALGQQPAHHAYRLGRRAIDVDEILHARPQRRQHRPAVRC